MKKMKSKFTIYTELTENYTIRTETYQGKSYIVVPTVMMREGVHSGSHGPLLHTIDELGRYPESWNGIPVVVQHPVDAEGNNISANEPNVLSEYSVGMVFNTHVEGNKLKAEVWLEQTQLDAHPEVLEYIEGGYPLDVSIGAFSDEELIEGEHNNEQYQGISRNHRPDHLALLPGGTGACSWNDGCGIRTNQKGELMKPKFVDLYAKALAVNAEEEGYAAALKAYQDAGYGASLLTCENGFMETVQLIQQKLDSMDNDRAVYYAEEVYDDHFIYRVVRREGNTRSSTYYRQDYTLNQEDDSVEMSGDPAEVRKDINFVSVNSNSNNKEEQTMKKTIDNNGKTPCCLAKVEQLIAHKATKFTEDDKELLLTFEEAVLDKMLPEDAKPEVKVNADDTIQDNAEEAVKAVKTLLSNPEEFKKLMPEDMLAQYNRGASAEAKYRTALIAGIQANSNKDVWEEDDLKGMSIDMLEKVAKSLPTANAGINIVDYSGANVNNNQLENTEDPLYPIGVDEDEEGGNE